MRLNEVLLRACIACGINWGLALQTAQKLQPVYEIVYPQVVLTPVVEHTLPLCLLHLQILHIYTDSRLHACMLAIILYW